MFDVLFGSVNTFGVERRSGLNMFGTGLVVQSMVLAWPVCILDISLLSRGNVSAAKRQCLCFQCQEAVSLLPRGNVFAAKRQCLCSQEGMSLGHTVVHIWPTY